MLNVGVVHKPFITLHKLNITVFLNLSHLYKWWSTLKTFLFRVNTPLPPIRTQNGSVTFDPSEMAEVFSKGISEETIFH